MLSTVVLPIAARTFSTHPEANSSILPSRYLTLFIRAGDKYKEAPLHSLQEYWPLVLNLIYLHRIRDVYLSTDSAEVLSTSLSFISSRHPDIRVYYIDYQRLREGLTIEILRGKIASQSQVRELINVILTDLFIAAHASGWVGTLSSNWCRIHDEFRSGNGRFGIPYLSLDGHWIGTEPVDEYGRRKK